MDADTASRGDALPYVPGFSFTAGGAYETGTRAAMTRKNLAWLAIVGLARHATGRAGEARSLRPFGAGRSP